MERCKEVIIRKCWLWDLHGAYSGVVMKFFQFFYLFANVHNKMLVYCYFISVTKYLR